MDPDFLAALRAAIMAGSPSGGSFQLPPFQHPLPGSGTHPGAQVQDGPLGENAQLGWGTAPQMVYPQQPQMAVPPASYASAVHKRPSRVAQAASKGPTRYINTARGPVRQRPKTWRSHGRPF